MKSNHLLAIEALLRNSHELAIGAKEQAREGGDAVLQHRLEALAKGLKAELTNVRATVKDKNRRTVQCA
jgi:hypothetical protein